MPSSSEVNNQCQWMMSLYNRRFLRCFSRMSRWLFDVAAVCIFFYSLWFYMSASTFNHLPRHATVGPVNDKEPYGNDDFSPGKPVDKELLFSGDLSDEHNDDQLAGEHFDNFDEANMTEAKQIPRGKQVFSNQSDAQRLLNYIASNVEVKLYVAEHTQQITALMINTGPWSILPGDWYIVLCHSQNHMKDKNRLLAGERLRLCWVEGNIFKLMPARMFKSFETGERIEFQLSVVHASSDYFPNWYVTAPGLQPRVLASTRPHVFRLDYSRVVDKHLGPAKRYQQHFDTSLQLLDGKEIHVLPTPFSITYRRDKHPVHSVGQWKDWAIMFTSDVSNEARYLSKKMGNLPFTFDRKNKFIQMTTGSVKLPRKVTKLVQSQAYRISYHPGHQSITIVGVTPTGVFYGIQTFLDLINHKGQLIADLPEFLIVDFPRLPYRGLMLDTVRSFIRKQEVFRTLETMAMYKLNVLHLHLSDDQGWRLEIPGLEELTKIGSKRLDDMDELLGLHPYLGAGPHADTQGSGYYTTEDYKQILEYANNRHIKVIPEIDTPGHSHAAIVSMLARTRRLNAEGQSEAASQYALMDPDDTSKYTAVNGYKLTTLNPCMDSAFTFLEHVISEIKEMHKDVQPLTVFHVGGDEVPKKSLTRSPLCIQLKEKFPSLLTTEHIQQYFMMKVFKLLERMNLTMQVWEDGVFSKVDPSSIGMTNISVENVQTQIWKKDKKERIADLAKQGYKMILSDPAFLYFDHKHEAHIEERGFSWATDFISLKTTFKYSGCEELKSLDPRIPKIIGIEGALWSETIQTKSHFHSMLYPRLLALAERAWHAAPWESMNKKNNKQETEDWNYFASLVSQKELYRLEKLGIEYYLPPPGVRTMRRNAYVNTFIPGLTVDLSTDTGFTWRTFHNGSEIPDERLFFATRSVGGERLSRIVSIMHETK